MGRNPQYKTLLFDHDQKDQQVLNVTICDKRGHDWYFFGRNEERCMHCNLRRQRIYRNHTIKKLS